MEEGYSILNRLQQHGLKPTAVTFSALMAVVAGAARQGKATLRDGEMVRAALVVQGPIHV